MGVEIYIGKERFGWRKYGGENKRDRNSCQLTGARQPQNLCSPLSWSSSLPLSQPTMRDRR